MHTGPQPPKLRYHDALRLVFASQAERRYAVGASQDDKRRARNARKAARHAV
jgi:hypothetical protein